MQKISLSLKNAFELRDQLKNLANHQLPGDLKFKIYQNISALDKHVESYVEARNGIIKEYGEPYRGQLMVRDYIGEQGNIKNPKIDKFKEEMETLETQEFEYELYLMPDNLFTADRELLGDMYAIFKHLIKK